MFIISILSLSQAASLSRASAAGPEIICMWRLCVASLLMLGVAYKTKRTLFPSDRRTLLFTLSAGFFFFLHLWCFQYSAQHAPIAHVMILFATNPLFTVLFAFIFQGKRPSKKMILAYIFAFLGVCLLFFDRLYEVYNMTADLLALISAILFSGYILSSQAARKQMLNSVFTFLIYSFSAILFFVVVTLQNISFTDYPSVTWYAILGLILFPTLLGHALFTYLLKYFDAHWMSTGKLAEPLFASISAYFFFSEPWHWQTSIAFIFTAFSLLVLFEPWNYLRGMKAKG